jgi:tetratricopeptide (TPR) repeat protein
MNKRLDEIGAAMDMEIIKKTIELLKIIRREDKEALKQALDEVYQVAENLENPRLMSSYATPYASIFNDEEKTIKLLEDINSKYFNYSAYNNLIYKYNKLNKIDSVLLLRQDFIKKFPDELVSYVAYINDLQKYEYYEEALEYIDKGFDIFPYSFTLMRLKGEVLVQLKKKKEALKWLKKSFTHDSGNSDLRNKIKDLEKTADPIKEVLIEKPYDFIAKERGKIKTETNYGLNIILEEKNVQVFKEGGNKTHTTYIYEVTSKKGIETLKEYNLGLSWGYIINKSEIIKPDGKIVPAERSKSNFVFNNLSIGDVVYIDFETYSSATGRFYKDFYDTYQTASYYPTNKIIYRLILEKGETIQTKITNGNLEFNKKKIGDFDVFEWTKNNSPILPSYESYMPEDCDVATILHVSTINDWSEISNWYSDLVRTQIKYNSTVNNLFDKLFLNGHKHLSDIEKAKKIYYYMMENLTYSYVSFKQSGFVPQKPSKTITTKLGDCKDFSTLFLALAKKADLEANLVLVSTSDLGINNLVLPSTDFNHCIVRVMIDGKEHYIELTNKYLPFDSTPRSLIKALALNIPYNSSETNQNTLFVLNKKAQTNNLRKVDHKLTIGKQTKKLEIINTSLNSNSYYRKLLSKKNIIELKKEIEELYENKIDLDLSFIDYKVNKNIKQDPEIIFTTYFKINNKFKKIGKMKLLRLPNFSTPYTSDIISKDERHYTIDYNKYESIDKYIINYDIILTDDMKFVEIPENAIHTFKNHQFSIKYNLINSNTELKVSLICKIDKNDISPEDYQDFKKFVNSVLEEYEVLIGFK